MRKSYRPYLFLLASLLLILSIPKIASEKMREGVIAFIFPISKTFTTDHSPKEEALQKLQRENALLAGEIKRLEAALESNMGAKLRKSLSAIPGHVIFRSPSSWNSSLWVNVGKADNLTQGKVVVAKNSPVVMGKAVVGVIDYVGEKQSRVRLITDSGLVPSVRAVRGEPLRKSILDTLDILKYQLKSFSCAEKVEKADTFLQQLDNMKKEVLQNSLNKPWMFAKGELLGSSAPLWRSSEQVLKGIGFNYDFADDEGPARDLRTGMPIDGSSDQAVALLQVGDLLVTTGMDGVFPEGLHVAVITQIDPLKEGDYYYSLQAKPCVSNLQELSLVFVMPPMREEELMP